jgi:hypothetical protein
MAVETVTKRTIWVAACKCGESDTRTENPPRERLCNCGEWVKYVEQSYTGKDRFGR